MLQKGTYFFNKPEKVKSGSLSDIDSYPEFNIFLKESYDSFILYNTFFTFYITFPLNIKQELEMIDSLKIKKSDGHNYFIFSEKTKPIDFDIFSKIMIEASSLVVFHTSLSKTQFLNNTLFYTLSQLKDVDIFKILKALKQNYKQYCEGTVLFWYSEFYSVDDWLESVGFFQLIWNRIKNSLFH